MVALMPQKDGHIVSCMVLKGLTMQTIPVDIMTISRPQVDMICESQTYPGWVSIAQCRNILREKALQLSDTFFLMINNDIVLKASDDIEAMVSFLCENQDHGAVAIDSSMAESIPDEIGSVHVSTSCMLIRREVLSKIEFMCRDGRCDCISLKDDMRKLPKFNKSCYLKGRKAVECSR